MHAEKIIEPEQSQEQEPNWLSKLGPGLIAGAADDDPSGIATYSQAGAQFGFGMLWTLVITYPLMVGIQIVSARIGRVTGHGLATNIRRHYPAWLLYPIVGLLLLANTINIAADVAAMGDAMKLVAGGPAQLYAVGFGLVSVLLQVFIPYTRYVSVLKWLTLALLAYVATVFVVHIPWERVAKEAVTLPALPWKPAFITTIVAVFGTTISPYLFFWQASQEVEELRADDSAHPLKKAPREARAGFNRIRLDTYIGMGFSNLVAFFIMLTTAVTLHLHGMTEIETSAQAATALRPIAGDFAFMLFALGIIGTGMLAIPVLAGSAAYAIAGAFKWKNSLEHEPQMAPKFYGIIVVATLAGVGLVFAPIDPIKALYWSAVINGVISIPIMAVMMLMASRVDVMGRLVIARRLKVIGWMCTAVMAAAVTAMLVTNLA
ncbi:divalent metal cation transporter [Massilia sp. R2A-15]|uniref:NRAMP family divalent metal transporter n=1 Tax=Massilia sp. R2A-15 TaxID=3064278 RepID=UPI0027325E22|nr:divalent metal cation transporter [Massilia sp. R2A-15]WLI90832.1 divalent metal cation transporter [Massilia sp. R2A-15]